MMMLMLMIMLMRMVMLLLLMMMMIMMMLLMTMMLMVVMMLMLRRGHFASKFIGHGHLRGHRFLRACTVEMHMDISQEPFYTEIYRKNAGRAGYHLD